MADEQSGSGIDPDFRQGMEEGVGTALAERVTLLEKELADRNADDEDISSTLELNGYPRSGGPVDQSVGMKAALALMGVSSDRDLLREELDAVKRDRDEQGRRADKAEAALTKARAKVTREDAPAKPRKLKSEGDWLSGDELDAAIAAAEADGKAVEIVFSDGKAEVPGIPPARVEGQVWKRHTRGKMLADPICVEGPSAGGASTRIAGYALLIDGKQVAYCERSEPLPIAPGAKVSIADDIYF